jgi:hypothetical protein
LRPIRDPLVFFLTAAISIEKDFDWKFKKGEHYSYPDSIKTKTKFMIF